MRKQIAYFDLLRLISSVAVIMIHTVMDHRRNIDLGSNDWQIFNIIFASMHFAVPIFFMMSGALFLDPNREIKVSTLYRKNILRLLTAYFGWSLVYAIFYGVINNWPPDIVLQLFFTSHHHLWFLPYLIVLYLLTPAFRPIARDKDALLYFVIGACILTFVLFTFNEPKIWALSSELIEWIDSKFPLSYIQGYLAYFLLGYYLYAYDVAQWIQKIALPASIFFTLLLVLVSSQFSIYLGYPDYHFTSYSSLLVGLQAGFIFIFFKYHHHLFFQREKIRQFISFVTPYLFGIYLAHDLFLIIFRQVLKLENLHLIIDIPLSTILTFICSLFLTYLIKKIPFVNKYLV